MWYVDDEHMDGAWGVVMALGIMGVWVALIAAVVFALVWTTRSTSAPSTEVTVPAVGALGTPASGAGGIGSAEQILAERLARGEIDTEEYRARLDAITTRSRP